jgi:hypothetical protein
MNNTHTTAADFRNDQVGTDLIAHWMSSRCRLQPAALQA